MRPLTPDVSDAQTFISANTTIQVTCAADPNHIGYGFAMSIAAGVQAEFWVLPRTWSDPAAAFALTYAWPADPTWQLTTLGAFQTAVEAFWASHDGDDHLVLVAATRLLDASLQGTNPPAPVLPPEPDMPWPDHYPDPWPNVATGEIDNGTVMVTQGNIMASAWCGSSNETGVRRIEVWFLPPGTTPISAASSTDVHLASPANHDLSWWVEHLPHPLPDGSLLQTVRAWYYGVLPTQIRAGSRQPPSSHADGGTAPSHRASRAARPSSRRNKR